MATTVTNLRLRFPEFSDKTEYPAPRLQMFLDDAARSMGPTESRWLGEYDYAQAYYAAHLMTKGEATELGDKSATVGGVKAASAGGVNITRAAVDEDLSPVDAQLMSTSYGQQYRLTRNAIFAGMVAING